MKSIHQVKIEAAEKAVLDSLPTDLRERIERAVRAPYKWPTYADGTRVPQGTCPACRQVDARHPEGTACDYSCVGL